jgi:hypothetical protein
MPGASRRVIALIVPPAAEDTVTPPTGPSNEDLSAQKRMPPPSPDN